MNGFMVFRNGVPAQMDLHDDIQGGLTIAAPFPIFQTEEDARDAARADAANRTHASKHDVRPVSVQFGEPVPEF
jgi:hypothetical protein